MLQTLLLTASVLLPQADAVASPADAAEAYAGADGFEPVEAGAVMDAIIAALEMGDGTESVFLPSSDLHALAMAVLALEVKEGPASRTRHRVASGTAWFDGDPAPWTFVEVTRFNLGPAVREALVHSLGEEAVAPVEEFGQAPHAAWRVVARPVMGNRAMIVASGRAHITGQQAGAAQCLGRPCLTAAPEIDQLAPWSDMERAASESDLLAGGSVPASAQAVDLLSRELPEPETGSPPRTPPSAPAPDMEMVIETGLGQDSGVDAALRQHGLLDDSVSAIWRRAALLPALDAVFRATAYECARGPDFAEPEGLCP
jgi:hypothetical protein